MRRVGALAAALGVAASAYAACAEPYRSDGEPSDAGADSNVEDGARSELDAEATDATDAPDATPVTSPCNRAAPFGTAKLVAGIDSAFGEFDARLTPDELTVYFSSNRPGGAGGFDLYTGTRASISDPFSNIRGFAELNSTSDDLSLSLNAGGTVAYFATRRDDDGGLASNIYTASRANPGFAFTNVVPAAGINSSPQNYGGFLRPDDVLWFASGRLGQGTLGIYTASLPVALEGGVAARDELNTAAGYTTLPVLSADGLTIYFGSSRPPTAGGPDIWMATRTSTTAKFVNLKRVDELATPTDDTPCWLSVDECTLYFSNNASGSYKIYQARRSL